MTLATVHDNDLISTTSAVRWDGVLKVRGETVKTAYCSYKNMSTCLWKVQLLIILA